MSYDNASLRAIAKERFESLLAHGPGVHAYALDAAEKLVRDEPMVHGGLVAHLEQQLGERPLLAARQQLKWFYGKGRG